MNLEVIEGSYLDTAMQCNTSKNVLIQYFLASVKQKREKSLYTTTTSTESKVTSHPLITLALINLFYAVELSQFLKIDLLSVAKESCAHKNNFNSYYIHTTYTSGASE